MLKPMPLCVFQEKTGINGNTFNRNRNIVSVVSLKDVVAIESIEAMSFDYLKKLLFNVTLEGNPEEKVYAHCELKTSRIDPDNLVIGQTFIQRSKYQGFLENFPDSFKGWCVTKGVAKCTAFIVFGRDALDNEVVAHYIPPLIEQNSGGQMALLDGTHRNFLVKMIGTTLESIIISGVKHKFPCALHDWKDVKIVDQKPPREERYFDLKPGLFRDLEGIGIDG